MTARQRALVLTIAFLCAACGGGGGATVADSGRDGVAPPSRDVGADALQTDSSVADRQAPDAPWADAPRTDAGTDRPASDSGQPDVARADAPRPDAARPDAPPLPPFHPTADTHLAGGSHAFSTVEIPTGVTVTADGDVGISTSGELRIAGVLRGDCTRIELRVGGETAITGTVDNRCPAGSGRAADLVIHSSNGQQKMALGARGAPATLETSGKLDVSNDQSLAEWELDLLPHQRATQRLAPSCSARANTLLSVISADGPVPVGFLGRGVDPDRGPVTYLWDFGDGASSTEKDPVHVYTGAGVFPATLTVGDSDGETCVAHLQVVLLDADPTAPVPAQPAVLVAPEGVVLTAGQEAQLTSAAASAGAAGLTYSWSLGDGTTSTDPHPRHAYAVAGRRYEVSLTVSDASGNHAQATATVYVAPPPPLPLRAPRPSATCNDPDNVVNFLSTRENQEVAAAGVTGMASVLRFRGDVSAYGDGPTPGSKATYIRGQAGGNHLQAISGSGTVLGASGGRGGDVELSTDGRIVLCGVVGLVAGNGGMGQEAESSGDQALARGGTGADGGSVIVRATYGIESGAAGAKLFLVAGNGGYAGSARAQGKTGDDLCPQGGNGKLAQATGGNAGNGGEIVTTTYAGVDLSLIVGYGGHGGNARATGGRGGHARGCGVQATGGNGGEAYAFGGDGGETRLASDLERFVNPLIEPPAVRGGGNGDALAGPAGDAQAEGPPCGEAQATGGASGLALSKGGSGKPGKLAGLLLLAGGDARAFGEKGGRAEATGGACTQCGNGGDATAAGGPTWPAMATAGQAGGAGAVAASAAGLPESGGAAIAKGGAGGLCETCPAGKGGDGGKATATGGDGGLGMSGEERLGGDGGAAEAVAGAGGKGAVCCPSHGKPKGPGGVGGKGGDASATSGQPGPGRGGGRAANAGQAGDGGQGGCGCMPGGGGEPGKGAGSPAKLPDGKKGGSGENCC